MSNNLNLDQVASNQTQKEVTINSATAQLDAALTEVLAVSMVAGNVVLTSAQFRGSVLFDCSGQTAARNLTIPGVKRGVFCVKNSSGSFSVNVVRGSTTIEVVAGATAIFSTDGTTNSLTKLAEAAAAAGTIPYDFGFFFASKPGAGALSGSFIAVRSLTLAAGLAGSQAKAGTASTGNVSFDIQKNGVSKGSVVFNISGTGTFTFTNPVTLAAGDTLDLVAPGVQDATLADIRITFAVTR